MSEFPTTEDLEKLCREKGLDALIWYAWRCAMRALPALGNTSIKQVWKDGTVRRVYIVCYPCLLLAQWLDAPQYIKDSEIYGAANLAYDAIEEATYVDEVVANAVKIVVDAAYAVDSLADAAESFELADVTYSIETIANLVTNATHTADIACDYESLLQQPCLTSKWWLSQPLWLENEPTKIKQWRQALDADLRQLGLGFLADDLNCLWESKPLGLHAQNYLKEYSGVELNDPVALRRLIMGEAEAEHIHAVRVLLLGPGGAGKSSLADRLQIKPISQTKKLTVGVDYLNH